MPDLTEQTDALIGWLSTNGVALAIVAIVLLVVYRWARPAIHRVLVNVMHAQAETLGEDGARKVEIDKRITTLEDLLAKVLRAAVVVALIVVVLGIFDLWSVLTGLGLALAAITLAGQAIVLDYLMGILILVEGQYFKGDIVRVGGIEGTVEEVGLRRTLIRDPRGHAALRFERRDPNVVESDAVVRDGRRPDRRHRRRRRGASDRRAGRPSGRSIG